MDNKHEAVWDWLYTCTEILNLFFNFGEAANGNTIAGTTVSDRAIKQYVDGTAVKQYDFAVTQFKPVNSQTPNNDENAQTLFDVEDVMRWVDTQNEARNYPDFPEGCQITKIENLYNMPAVAGQDELGAKYMFMVRINYIEKRG